MAVLLFGTSRQRPDEVLTRLVDAGVCGSPLPPPLTR